MPSVTNKQLKRIIHEEVEALDLTLEDKQELEESLWTTIAGTAKGLKNVGQYAGNVAGNAAKAAGGAARRVGSAVKKAVADKVDLLNSKLDVHKKNIVSAMASGRLDLVRAEIEKLVAEAEALEATLAANSTAPSGGTTAAPAIAEEEALMEAVLKNVQRKLLIRREGRYFPVRAKRGGHGSLNRKKSYYEKIPALIKKEKEAESKDKPADSESDKAEKK